MSLKKRTPKEVIESAPSPENERAFIKYPREEPVDVTAYAGEHFVYSDENKKHLEFQKHKKQKYTDIHTHIYSPNYIAAMPSQDDLKQFLLNNNEKTMVIAVKSKNNKDVLGYSVFSKTEKTPELRRENFYRSQEIRDRLSFGGYRQKNINSTKKITKQDKLNLYSKYIDRIKREYHLKSRIVPAKGYLFDEKSLDIIKKSKLEKIATAGSVLMFLSGLLLLSQNITGNTILEISQKSSNLIGTALFFIGILGFFFYFRKRN